jgi:Ca2+-binding RTX toxin-like protein
MAKLYAYATHAYDYQALNLNELMQPGVTRYLDNAARETFEGVTYEDMFWFDLPTVNGTRQSVAFSGPFLTANGATLTGGTVTSIRREITSDQVNWSAVWHLGGIDVSSAVLWNAAGTSGTADDLAAMESALSGHDQFFLGAANDRARGYLGGDTLQGGGGNDWLSGDGDYDYLDGGTGNDTLNGGTEADLMRGGAGNDLYFVDNISDNALETSATSTADAGGIDTIQSTIAYNLGNYMENLVLAGSASVDGRGNALANRITGNVGANVLTGLAGNDVVSGGGGNDQLTGGEGQDTVDGGGGADTVIVSATSGVSSDSARVFVTGANNDRGADTALNFNLSSDTLKIVGTEVSRFVHGIDTAIGTGTGTGNTGSQASFAANVGLVELNQVNNNAWHDAGDIAVSFVTPSAALTESAFESRLQYDLVGTQGDNVLTAGRRADRLNGSNGNDTLTGGMGADTLAGGFGADVFVFNSTLESGGEVATRDVITDFDISQDRLDLRGIDADTALAGDQAFSGTFVLSGNPFTAAGQLKSEFGMLYGNTDADAEAEFAIALAGVHEVTAAHLML